MIGEFEPGDTLKIRWVSSGTTPADVTYSVINGVEAVVNTGTLINSGSGLWYNNYTVPDTLGYYVVRTTATISGNEYKRAKRFRVIPLEVD